jgi:hypothetical protein
MLFKNPDRMKERIAMVQKCRWLVVLMMFSLVLSGCAPLYLALQVGTINEMETTGPIEPVEQFWSADGCPMPVAGTEVLKNPRNGYCLLYPETYAVVRPNQFQTYLLIGGLLNVADPRVDIMVEDARGRTAEEIADELQFDVVPGDNIVRTNITVAGQEAVVLDNVPGQEISRRVVFVYEDRLYHLTFMPADANLGEIYERMEALYAMVINSFSLIPVVEPAADDPAALCPEPTGDLQLLVNEREGYCALYPSGYVVEQPTDTVTLLVGPDRQDPEHPRLSIEVEDALGRTTAEVATAVAEEYADAGASASFGVLVGGGDGWQVDNVPGQDVGRHVYVVFDGRLYRFIFTPADPERPESYAQMEELYKRVINSFSFFPPTAPTGITR